MRRSRLKRLLVALAIVVAVLVAARLALDPMVTWRTRRVLSGLDHMRGTFSSVDVSLHDLSYGIRDLRIEKIGAGGERLPYFTAHYAHFGLYWGQLLRGHVVAGVQLIDPKLNVVQATAPKKTPRGAQQIEETPKVGRRIEELAPFRLDRLEIKNGEILFVDAHEPGKPKLWLHSIEGTLENFATRPALAKDEPTVLAMKGEMQRSGKVNVFATADPLAKNLNFAGQGRLEGLRLVELGDLVSATSKVTPDKGTLDMSIRFRAKDGRVSGGVRPVLNNAGTRPAKPGIGAKLESALADAAIHVFSDKVPGRNAVATTIPLTGTVTAPSGQAVPTIAGILRNAFVRGLGDSLQGLPPPKAKKPESTLEQARRALSPHTGEPRAQPKDRK